VNVQRLRLIDVGSAVRGHIQDDALLDLPYCLVQLLDLRRQIEVLHAAVVGHKLHAQILSVQSSLDEVREQVPVHLDKLPGKHAANIEVLCVWLE